MLLHPDAIAALVVVAGAALVTGLGLAEVPAGWIVGGTVVLSGVGVLVSHAARPDVSDHTRVRLLAAVIGLLLLLLVGFAGYVRWWDPTDIRVRPREFVLADATETQCVRVSGEPGGEPLVLAPNSARGLAPICGSAAYLFEWRGHANDGSAWLRLAGSSYWLPEALLRPRVGTSARGLPDC